MRKSKTKTYSQDTIINALKDYKRGMSYADILVKYGISDSGTLAGWARKTDTERPPEMAKFHDWEKIGELVNGKNVKY
jgi:uncharacterized protein YjcR